MRLVGKKIHCLLDTGCDVTLVPQDIIEKHKSIRMTPVNRYLQAANDTDIEITGEVTLHLMLNDRCIMTHALVSPDVGEIMLGVNWLYDHKCVWDFANRQISVHGCAAVPMSTEQFTFEVVHRKGAQHGNADALSRRPDAHREASVAARDVKTVDVRGADALESDDTDAPEPNDVDEEVPGSAAEHPDTVELTLADQQQQDPEFGSLVRMRLQQTHPLANEEMQAESAAAKELLRQWDQLEVRDGIVYRRWALKNGTAEALQLLVPGAHRQDFLKKVQSGMTGGHLGVNEPWTKFNVERLGLFGGVTSSDSADSVKAAMVTFEVDFLDHGLCSQCWQAHPSRSCILMSRGRILAPVEVRSI